jgi:enamine deaminase RidA (YjgF/YER057c/UK114 family)
MYRGRACNTRPKAIADYSEAFVIDNHVFAAGQLASDFATGIGEQSLNKW